MIMTKATAAHARMNNDAIGEDPLYPSGEFHVELLHNGEDSLLRLEQEPADFIAIGAVLSARSGKELCRLLRNPDGKMKYPVMLLRATNSMETPRARTPWLHSRTDAPIQNTIRLADMEINPERHEVIVAGRIVDFTAAEFRLLHLLTKEPGRAFSRDRIMEQIRGKGYTTTPRSVDVLIVGIRRKLGPIGRRIQSVRSVGYRYRE